MIAASDTTNWATIWNVLGGSVEGGVEVEGRQLLGVARLAAVAERART